MIYGLIIITIVVLFFILMYNSFIRKINQVEFAYSGINVQLKKRHDLIPNLVSCVKEYMTYERGLLEKITALRTRAASEGIDLSEKMKLEGELSSLLKNLMVVVENYPALKANENFLHLQASLNEIEEQIAAARRAYNSSVTDLNNAIQVFPANIVASLMRLKKRPWFEIKEEEMANPNIENSFKGV